jgi:hypothetical protein
MAEKLKATNVTREAWDFLTDHFLSLIKIVAIPLILAITLEGFIEIYYNAAPPSYTKAGVDALYAIIEAMWGVRWLRYLLEPPRQNKYFMAPFRFGTHEVRYALYALAISFPILLDDIAISLPIPHIAVTGLMLIIFLSLFLVIRLEFIFPAIAISHATSFSSAWKKSKSYWGPMIVSFLQSLIIMIPVLGILSLIGFGLFLLVWGFGLTDVKGWTYHSGFNVLFQNNPAILGIYFFIKESAWFLVQALLLTIVGIYYRDASVKLVSRK